MQFPYSTTALSTWGCNYEYEKVPGLSHRYNGKSGWCYIKTCPRCQRVNRSEVVIDALGPSGTRSAVWLERPGLLYTVSHYLTIASSCLQQPPHKTMTLGPESARLDQISLITTAFVVSLRRGEQHTFSHLNKELKTMRNDGSASHAKPEVEHGHSLAGKLERRTPPRGLLI